MQTKKTFDSIANPPERGRLERPGAGFAPGRDLVGASRAQPGRRLAITKHWLVDPRTLFGGRPRPGFPACFGPPRGPRINALEGNPQKTGHKLQVVNYRMLTSSGSCSAELFFKPLIIGNSCREFFSVDNFCCPQTYPQKSRKLSTGRAGGCSAECSWDLAGFPPGVVQRKETRKGAPCSPTGPGVVQRENGRPGVVQRSGKPLCFQVVRASGLASGQPAQPIDNAGGSQRKQAQDQGRKTIA